LMSRRSSARAHEYGRDHLAGARPSLCAISRASSSIICGVTFSHFFASPKDFSFGVCFLHLHRHFLVS
jgi:hypothetical protein